MSNPSLRRVVKVYLSCETFAGIELLFVRVQSDVWMLLEGSSPRTARTPAEVVSMMTREAARRAAASRLVILEEKARCLGIVCPNGTLEEWLQTGQTHEGVTMLYLCDHAH